MLYAGLDMPLLESDDFDLNAEIAKTFQVDKSEEVTSTEDKVVKDKEIPSQSTGEFTSKEKDDNVLIGNSDVKASRKQELDENADVQSNHKDTAQRNKEEKAIAYKEPIKIREIDVLTSEQYECYLAEFARAEHR